MKFLLIVSLWLSGLALSLNAQKPEVVHLEDFLKFTQQDNDTLYVLNFWSTWCKPCVAELPHFDRIQKEMEDQKVKVVLFSLDFKKEYASRLIPFLEKKKLYPKVLFLDEPKFNDWIDRVDSTWSGSIPATLIVQHSRGIRKFHEGSFTYESLKATISSSISTE